MLSVRQSRKCHLSTVSFCRNVPSLDVKQHILQPLHKRQHWASGFMQFLSATTSVSSTGEYIQFTPVLPLHGCTKVCRACAAECEIRPSGAVIITITLQGRFNLSLPVWTCPSCRVNKEVTNLDLVRCGCYKASPVTMSTVVHEDVFVMWQSLKFHSPGTPLSAFVKTLEVLGSSCGSPGPVDLQRLEKAYTEWSCMQFELQKLTGADFMVCEACGAEPRCVHVDGNFKVYRYRSSGSGEALSAYHVGTCIEDKEAVDAHVGKLEGVTKTSNRCGVSSWVAGRNSLGASPSKSSQDETGLVTGTCRHSVILGGVNMYRGELYAYSHFLQQVRFPNVQYFASDIACKYWPWTQRVARMWPEHDTGNTRPFLSVMHATGHAYYCQITYGGFGQDGSGWSVMETTEIANAFLSRTGNTTKYMTSAQRIDAITDMILSYNRDKHQRMPELLVKKLQDAEKRIPDLEARLNSLLEENRVDPSQVGVLVEELRLLATCRCTRDVQTDGRNLENAIEMVSDSLRVRRATLSRTVDSSKKRSRIRRQISADKTRLTKLLKKYQNETGVGMDLAGAEEGCFPWHVQSKEAGDLSLSAKRAICDTHLRLHRAHEELMIVKEEMRNLLTCSSGIIEQLVQKLMLVEEQPKLPEDQWARVVQPTPAFHRYCIRDESTSVLQGLRALIYEAVAQRQVYLTSARSCLEQHLRG